MKKIYYFFIVMMIIGSISIPNSNNRNFVKAAETPGVLANQLNNVINTNPDLAGAIAGISIRSAANGKILYSHQGDIRLRPASNMKLLTAAAALDVLGENYTFPTEVYKEGNVNKKTLFGDVYLKGKGDPTLMKADFDKMAMDLKKLGIKKIKGDIIGDDSWYDDVRYSLDLPWSDETAYYGAQISALTASPDTDYDAGSILVEVKPGAKIGDSPKVKLTPNTNYIELDNQATTIEVKGQRKITIERLHAKNTIVIKGTIPVKSKEVKEWVGIWNPTRYAVTLFKDALTDQGIKITGNVKTGLVPDTAEPLLVHQSMPLSQLVVPLMKLSNNGIAEVLIKEMGKTVKGEGSWDKGLEVVKQEIGNWGVDTNTLVLRDGSGVSHVDLIPANQISQLLFVIQKEKWFPVYLNSLPIAGISNKMTGGSLRNRLKNSVIRGKVKAKTGTLTTVSSLSGYINSKSGQTLIFSILLNNMLDEEKGKQAEDRLVSILARQ